MNEDIILKEQQGLVTVLSMNYRPCHLAGPTLVPRGSDRTPVRLRRARRARAPNPNAPAALAVAERRDSRGERVEGSGR